MGWGKVTCFRADVVTEPLATDSGPASGSGVCLIPSESHDMRIEMPWPDTACMVISRRQDELDVFTSACTTIPALIFSSTGILRSQASSASDFFIRALNGTSMPPYFERHF